MADQADGPGCPAREDLEGIAATPTDDGPLADHLRRCDSCAALVREIREGNRLLEEFVRANADRFDAGGSGTPASTAPPDWPTIPDYLLHEEVHRGTQGVVYRGLETKTRRNVAVKTLKQGALASRMQRRRFEREVELVAALDHPNIVTLFRCGRTGDGGHYLAMQYVEGVPLDRYVRRMASEGAPLSSRRTVRRLLELFCTICEAIRHAHQHGVIHRDLKPENILVDADGQPHVLDFGLAKRQPVEGERADASTTSETMIGEFLGTFAYASPEQVSGDPAKIDVRTDVYALGVILYQLLTARRPYALSGSVEDVVASIRKIAPRLPSAFNRAVGTELDAIVLQAVAKDPGERYQSAGRLRDDVAHYLAGEPISALRGNRWYVLRKLIARHRLAVGASAGVGLLVIAFGVTMALLYRGAEADAGATRAAAASMAASLRSPEVRRTTGDELAEQILDDAKSEVEAVLADDPQRARTMVEEMGLGGRATKRSSDQATEGEHP